MKKRAAARRAAAAGGTEAGDEEEDDAALVPQMHGSGMCIVCLVGEKTLRPCLPSHTALPNSCSLLSVADGLTKPLFACCCLVSPAGAPPGLGVCQMRPHVLLPVVCQPPPAVPCLPPGNKGHPGLLSLSSSRPPAPLEDPAPRLLCSNRTMKCCCRRRRCEQMYTYNFQSRTSLVSLHALHCMYPVS